MSEKPEEDAATAAERTLVDITDEDEAAVIASREAAPRGEFATDEDLRAIWAKYGL